MSFGTNDIVCGSCPHTRGEHAKSGPDAGKKCLPYGIGNECKCEGFSWKQETKRALLHAAKIWAQE